MQLGLLDLLELQAQQDLPVPQAQWVQQALPVPPERPEQLEQPAPQALKAPQAQITFAPIRTGWIRRRLWVAQALK